MDELLRDKRRNSLTKIVDQLPKPVSVLRSTTMDLQTLEGFVDADEAGKFLSLNRRRILELARAQKLPGHPIGDGARRVWRFRLSELAHAISSKVVASDSTPSYGSTDKAVLRAKSESK
jgi:hypothetical protein